MTLTRGAQDECTPILICLTMTHCHYRANTLVARKLQTTLFYMMCVLCMTGKLLRVMQGLHIIGGVNYWTDLFSLEIQNYRVQIK